MHSSIRPVKARDHSDGALTLWCMPPWSSPVIYCWCATTGGQRPSRCSPDVRAYLRAHGAFYGSVPTFTFGSSEWLKADYDSSLLSLTVGLSGSSYFHYSHSTYANFSSCQAVTCRAPDQPKPPQWKLGPTSNLTEQAVKS